LKKVEKKKIFIKNIYNIVKLAYNKIENLIIKFDNIGKKVLQK